MSYKVRKNVSLSTLTTFQQAGEASLVLECSSISELQAILSTYPNAVMIGKGSNLLIDIKHLNQPLVKWSTAFMPPQYQNGRLTAGAGVTVHHLMQALVEHGVEGLEFMAGVPASVGGMIAMNFGCWGQDMARVVESVTLSSRQGEIRECRAEDMGFEYRNSKVHKEQSIVVAATFKVSSSDPEDVKKRIKDNIQKRLKSQPLRGKTFGSVFKNPEGHHAGKCVETAGLKGHVYQDVMFSELHANFMVNTGHATFEMAEALMQQAQEAVLKNQSINLEREVKIVP